MKMHMVIEDDVTSKDTQISPIEQLGFPMI